MTTPGLLADRRFALLLSARTISTLGSGISHVALAFAVLDRAGATAITLGVVLAAQAIPEMLFLLIGGVIADRFPRYRVMVGAEIAAGLSFAGLAALFLTDGPLTLVIALAAISGVAMAMFWPAFTGIVPQVVPNERLESANGLLQLTTNISRMLGIAIAGALVAVIGPSWTLGVNAASFLMSAVLLAGVSVPTSRGKASGGMLGDLRHGWHEFASRQWLWVNVLQFSLLNAALIAGLGILGPLIADRDLGGAAAWSIILAGGSIGTIPGVLIAMRIRTSRPILVASISTCVAALPFLLLGLGAPILVVTAATFLTGISLNVSYILRSTALQRHIPTETLSRASSYDTLGQAALGTLALLCAGPIVGLAGIDTALISCGGLVLLAGTLALASPQVRSFPAHAATTPAIGVGPL